MKVAFISSALQQPRHQKRISALEGFCDVEVFYYLRKQYRINVAEGLDGVFMGEVEDGKYYKRVFHVLKLMWKMMFGIDKNVYCTSVEQALIACLFKKKVILELGDIRQLDNVSRLYRFLDSYFLKRLSGLVLTSPYFDSNYYSKYKNYEKERVLVVENKLPANILNTINDYRSRYKGYNKRKKKIGLIGSIRYPNVLKRLSSLMSEREDLELHIFGDGDVSAFEGVPNCYFHGAFKNPEALPDIYNFIHLNIIFYDVDNGNVKLALPNKLYESIAFLRPIVCAKGCALSDEVERMSIGVSADIDRIESAIDFAFRDYSRLVDNLRMLEEDAYIDNVVKLKSFVEDAFTSDSRSSI